MSNRCDTLIIIVIIIKISIMFKQKQGKIDLAGWTDPYVSFSTDDFNRVLFLHYFRKKRNQTNQHKHGEQHGLKCTTATDVII